MREVIAMWRTPRMVALVVAVASLVAAVRIPAAGVAVVPGLFGLQPSKVIPLVGSLLVGPAAAWGAATGTIVGDAFAGRLTLLSGFEAVGTFWLGLLGYQLWGNLGPLSCGDEPDFRGRVGPQLVEFWAISAVGAAGSAAITAWGADLLGLLPFAIYGTTVALTTLVTTGALGPVLLYFVYPPVKSRGLLYPVLLRPEDPPTADPLRRRIGAYGTVAVAVGWFVLGSFVSVGPGGIPNRALGAVGILLLLVTSWLSGERLSSLM